MEFCDVCENMLYLTIRNETDDDHTLWRKCNKCGNEIELDGISVVSTMSFISKEQYSNVINKFTKFDPTLPRISIPCPNKECKYHTADSTDIIYVRYDNEALKYVYLCPLCDTIWKPEKNT